MEEYSAFCALWRTDLSFHSTITVSNQLANTGIDAIPTLYMADGTQWELPAIHLGKSGVQDLDINQALSNAPAGIRAHLSSYGSAAIRYRYDWQGAVYATMSIVDLTRSLSHVYPFVFPPDQGIRENISPKTRAYRDAINGIKYEGLWFRKTHNTGGFLALANTSSALLNVGIAVSGLRNPANRRVSIEGHNTALVGELQCNTRVGPARFNWLAGWKTQLPDSLRICRSLLLGPRQVTSESVNMQALEY
jgi:hypothetical protein